MATLRNDTLWVEETWAKWLNVATEKREQSREALHLVHVVEAGYSAPYALATDGMRAHLVRLDKVEGETGSFVWLPARKSFIRVADNDTLKAFRDKTAEVLGKAIADEQNRQYHLSWWSDIRIKGSAKAILGLNGAEDEVILRGIEMYNPPEDCWMVDYEFLKPLRAQISNVLRARKPTDHKPLVFGTEGLLAVVMPMFHPDTRYMR